MAVEFYAPCEECGGTVVTGSLFPACKDCGKVAPGERPIPTEPESDHGQGALEESGGFLVPDIAHYVVGWRAWIVQPGDGTLYSVINAQSWPARQVCVAQCQNDIKLHTPGEGCGCGFYAAVSLRHLQDMNYNQYVAEQGDYRAVGEVRMWGKLRQGTLGWRSQFAYPHKLYLPYEAHSFADDLEETYGVPVGFKNHLPDEG